MGLKHPIEAPEVVAEVRRRQLAAGLSDAAFSRELTRRSGIRIHHTNWTKVRTGHGLGPKVMRAIWLAYPDLRPALARALSRVTVERNADAVEQVAET